MPGFSGILGDAFGVEVQCFVGAQTGAHELGPAVAGEVAGEELALAAHFLGFGIHVIHEFVNQGDGDLLHLDLGSGTLPTRMSRAVSMRRLVSESSIMNQLAKFGRERNP